MRRLIFPLILGLCGAAVLLALGVWQLQRLAWKEAVLTEIAARITAAPVALPPAPDVVQDRYLAVAVEGRFLPGEILVLVSLKSRGPGYRVISGFETSEGRRILIDRGYLAEADKASLPPAGPARLTGNLHWPDEVDSFTPEPDQATGLWFARDVPALATALGTEPVLVILRQTSETDLAVAPLPIDSGGIPNDHLGYAITWFGLAVVWLGMTAHLIRRITRAEG